LKRLQTEYVDEWRMHNVWSVEELDKVTAPGGALEAAVEATSLFDHKRLETSLIPAFLKSISRFFFK
jgi:hypothetical protein